MAKLSLHFYQNKDITDAAKLLLGKYLCTEINGVYCSAMIVETEAYNGVLDKACHAFGGRRTKRTEVMFQEGGVAYVYLCYGIHHLVNVIFGPEDDPLAVLIRAVEPVEGTELMMQRRKLKTPSVKISAGPGLVTQAMGIDMKLNAASLGGDDIWIEDRGVKISSSQIISASRIGVAYAQEDALLPYRFYIRDHPFVSKKN